MNTDPAQDGVNVIGKWWHLMAPCWAHINYWLTSISENILHLKDLQKKLSAVENEFDVQRAKLKELFLQKEGN